MKMIKAFNKATKKFTDYFNYIEKELDKPTKELEESIYLINSHITLWQHDENYSDDDFLTVFAQKFKNKFIIYNITPRKLQVKTNQDKIKDLKSPDFSSYTLEYLMSFSIDVKKHLSANPDDVIIIHDDNQIGKIFSLLSCLLSYTVTVSNAPMPPLDAYYTITSLNDDFKNIALKADCKNQGRYLNYFTTVQNNPIIAIKKYYLKAIIINGAPAIENSENSMMSPYITINKKSFYCPVIRITSNGKVIYCSYRKDTPVQAVNFSAESAAKFDVDSMIFNDVSIEVLHKAKDKFKLLFVIQFNTFFIEDTAIRFSKDQIDSIHKDIRYPNEFFVDLLLDQSKEIDLSSYEEESIKWKSLLSEFILQGYQTKKTAEVVEEVKKEDKKGDSSLNSSDKDDDITAPTSSTVNKVQELLEKIEGKDKGGDDDDDEDIDVDDYINNLDKKAK